MTRKPSFSKPTITLADLVAAYHDHNRSFAEFLDEKRPARTTSQIPPVAPPIRESATRMRVAAPKPGVSVCDHCNQRIKRGGVADLGTGRNFHSFCWTVVTAKAAAR